jgi:hypothetical protein
MRMAEACWVGVVLAAVAQMGCSDGGTITVPCEPAVCRDTCVSDGHETGMCNADGMCVCRPRIMAPPGATLGLSSGGLVERRSSSYQLTLTVGPVAPAAVPEGPADLELGIQTQLDPERVPRP